MKLSRALLFLCLGTFGWIGWWSQAGTEPTDDGWKEIAPGIFQSPGWPRGYAIADGDEWVLFDAPRIPKDRPLKLALLTGYHRETCRGVGELVGRRVPVQAPKEAQEWLAPDKVQKYWKDSLPLRTSRTAYLVVAQGLPGIEFSLAPSASFTWKSWTIEVHDAPGHARGQLAFLVHKKDGPRVLFAGGALAEPGKLWAPYTTDWDHWTDAGLAKAARSLRNLAELKPDLVCPAHGDVIPAQAVQALLHTAHIVEEVGFLKSFERFTKERLKDPPRYDYIVPMEQPMSNGSKPWARISEHLWITGNTYVLASKDGFCLMVDPWDKRGADQFALLQRERKLGPLEVVLFSHAHYDHFDGVYFLPDRDRFATWALDLVARPIAEPFLLRAPFLDARPVRFERRPRDGESLTWREYTFCFHHLPGQSEFTMGVETVIDGKKCFFTADNFFHQDMFSGSGGWMGLNRSFPPLYAASARKVLDARPDWVLAEHGGPYEFNAEDFRRRVLWGEAAGKAADALSPSGNHRFDWNPHTARSLPVLRKAKPGQQVEGEWILENPLDRGMRVRIEFPPAMKLAPVEMKLNAGQTFRKAWTWIVPPDTPPGRQVFPLRVELEGKLHPADAFAAIDVE